MKINLKKLETILDNVKSALKMGFSSDVANMLRGERDFWINQLKIKGV